MLYGIIRCPGRAAFTRELRVQVTAVEICAVNGSGDLYMEYQQWRSAVELTVVEIYIWSASSGDLWS